MKFINYIQLFVVKKSNNAFTNEEARLAEKTQKKKNQKLKNKLQLKKTK